MSWGSHNKIPQTGWPKTAEIYSLILETRRPKSRCLWGLSASEGSREEPLPFLDLVSGVADSPWHFFDK